MGSTRGFLVVLFNCLGLKIWGIRCSLDGPERFVVVGTHRSIGFRWMGMIDREVHDGYSGGCGGWMQIWG